MENSFFEKQLRTHVPHHRAYYIILYYIESACVVGTGFCPYSKMIVAPGSCRTGTNDVAWWWCWCWLRILDSRWTEHVHAFGLHFRKTRVPLCFRCCPRSIPRSDFANCCPGSEPLVRLSSRSFAVAGGLVPLASARSVVAVVAAAAVVVVADDDDVAVVDLEISPNSLA
ncbi:hypothetical protein Tsp_03617 [Trichinella spiralis]|uniref:hypothetical protein n=1 Tax=Trichinella spiralis TaxID=6334 RepID=UPI0001EFBBEE|nr:hypothetical protein Tsp_03617 [Trichinella spiralis]